METITITEKQLRPDWQDQYVVPLYDCPACHAPFSLLKGDPYCVWCGVKLDWKEVATFEELLERNASHEMMYIFLRSFAQERFSS